MRANTTINRRKLIECKVAETTQGEPTGRPPSGQERKLYVQSEISARRASIAKSRSRCDGLTFKLASAMPRGPKMCSCKYFSSRSPLTFSTILPAKSKAQRGGGWRGKASAAALYRVQLFSRRNTQSEIASPLLMSACTRPSIMKAGDTWIPFWRAYLQCHLISRSRSRIAKASESLAPL
jgi:hypothetical protein